MLVTLDKICKSFLDEVVLRDVSFSINENERIGLLGVNGAGKSTLLNIITGILPFDSGTRTVKSSLEIGYLKQNEALNSENTLREEIEDALSEVYDVREKLLEASKRISASTPGSEEYRNLSEAYEKLTNQYDALDGYTADTRINIVLNGLGFGDFNLEQKTAHLSGGEKIRFGIAKILLHNPELLILDEPTNHLDFTMLTWLEDYLSSYKGSVLIVSHDRYFLDKVADNICEIENGGLYKYKGGYSAFLTQKEERIRHAEKEYEKQQSELAAMRDYVAKNLAKSSSSNSVGSRVKALEKMELQAKPNPKQKEVHFKFEYDFEPHKVVLSCKDVGIYVGNAATGKQLYENISLEVLKGEKIAIIGKNGVGKSSFLKAVLKKIPYTGQIKFGGNVKVAYFDQELGDLNLDDTVIEAVHRAYPTKTEFEIRSALGRLLIEDEAVFKRVRDLSGANRAKVAFCIIMFKRANVLIFDEPTNHLDYIAKEALDDALKEFTGTLITVSHDRYFLNCVPDKIIEMFPTGFNEYNGGYDYYLEHKKPEIVEKTVKADSENKAAYKENKKNKADDRKRRAKLLSLQREMDSLEAEIATLKAESEKPDVSSDYQKLSDILALIADKESCLEDAETEWLELSE